MKGLNYCQCDQPWRADYRHLTSRPCYRIEDFVLDSEKAPVVDMVAHPPHYTNGPKCPGCDRTIECIDITRWLPFNPGNTIKYLWRRYFGGKVGEDSIEPVRKARWYLDDEVARLESEAKS